MGHSLSAENERRSGESISRPPLVARETDPPQGTRPVDHAVRTVCTPAWRFDRSSVSVNNIPSLQMFVRVRPYLYCLNGSFFLTRMGNNTITLKRFATVAHRSGSLIRGGSISASIGREPSRWHK
jgi:hypothetical protein